MEVEPLPNEGGSEDYVNVCIGYLMYRIMKNKRKRRRKALLPINCVRFLRGVFQTEFNILRKNDFTFFKSFRMSTKYFDELSVKLKHTLTTNEELTRGLPYTPQEMLAITLKYLASGCTYTKLHLTFGVGVITASLIIRKVCLALWITLQNESFPQPSVDKWRRIAKDFSKRANFPNCVGAVDSKLVQVVKPEHDGSVILLAVADSDYNFTYIDVHSYKKNPDLEMFKNCALYKELQENTLNLPSAERLSDVAMPLPFVFVSTKAFGVSNNLMGPYLGEELIKEKLIFNHHLSRALRYVEGAFAILSNKWHIFHNPMKVSIDSAVSITKACCALHNFVIERDGVKYKETLKVNGFQDIELENMESSENRWACLYRNAFTNYFSSPECALSWANKKS